MSRQIRWDLCQYFRLQQFANNELIAIPCIEASNVYSFADFIDFDRMLLIAFAQYINLENQMIKTVKLD